MSQGIIQTPQHSHSLVISEGIGDLNCRCAAILDRVVSLKDKLLGQTPEKQNDNKVKSNEYPSGIIGDIYSQIALCRIKVDKICAVIQQLEEL